MFFLGQKKESDFIQRVNYYKPQRSKGKTLDQFTPEDKQVLELLEKIKAQIAPTEYIKKVKEKIYLTITDREDLVFFVSIDGSNIDIKIGFDDSDYPTIDLPLATQNLINFTGFMEKGTLTEEEIQRIVFVLALPAVRSFYYSEMVNKLQNVSILRLHKLLHLELTNPKGYTLNGVNLSTKLTVMNVMGQFIILPGWHGVAPVTFSVDWKGAIEYYELLRYRLPHAKSLQEKKKLFDDYMDLRKRTLTTNEAFNYPDNR